MKRDLEKAKGIVNQSIEKARGSAEQRQLESDGLLYERQRQADAILTEATARAEALTAKAKALAGSGGENMVKLEIARALKGKRIVFVPAGGGADLRTTDINELLGTYAATKK
jgi:cell division septum initiation protein DivIVA